MKKNKKKIVCRHENICRKQQHDHNIGNENAGRALNTPATANWQGAPPVFAVLDELADVDVGEVDVVDLIADEATVSNDRLCE